MKGYVDKLATEYMENLYEKPGADWKHMKEAKRRAPNVFNYNFKGQCEYSSAVI
jgi:hypothetical protein